MVDLLEVQRRANEAHRNFLAASDLDSDTHLGTLVSYIDGFLKAPEKRPEGVRQIAESARAKLNDFRRVNVDLTVEISMILQDRNLVVNSASLRAAELLMKGFGKHLDNIKDAIERKPKSDEKTDEIDEDSEIETIKAEAADVGYAVALVEQLSANLIVERLEDLQGFCTEYLTTKTKLQVIAGIRDEDVVEILSVVVSKFVDNVSMLGLFKKPLEWFDKRQKPKAGVKPGHTDILIELNDILNRYAKGFSNIALALAEAKAYVKTLGLRVGVRL